MNHLTKEEFTSIVNKGGMFKLPELFYGTIRNFEDCFFDNATYENIIDFANEEGVILQEYTLEEHLENLRNLK